MHVFNSLAPIFFILALGWALRAGGFLPRALVGDLNRLVYWVGVPALLVHEIVRARPAPGDHIDAVIVLLAVTLGCLAAGYLAVVLLRVKADLAGTLVQATFRGNLAYIGLPVVVYTSGADGEAVAITVLLMASAVPFYNVFSVIVLQAGRHRLGWRAVGRMIRGIIINPVVLSCVVGLAWVWADWPMPLAFERTLGAIAQMALPLALLGIGATLDVGKARGHLPLVVAAALIKVILAPLAGWFIGPAVGLGVAEMRVLLILLACPTAAITFIFADQLGGDRELAAGTVAASTLVSMAALWIIIWSS
jgi:predicted permease